MRRSLLSLSARYCRPHQLPGRGSRRRIGGSRLSPCQGARGGAPPPIAFAAVAVAKNAAAYYTATSAAAPAVPTNVRCSRQPSKTARRFSAASAPSPPYNPSSTSSSSSSQQEDEETDVLIVGGGAVGCAVAYQLARHLPPGALRVGLVEAGPGPKSARGSSGAPPPGRDGDDDAAVPNPRSYALSPSSLEIVGLYDSIDGDSRRTLGWYDSMQVWEASQPAALVLTGRDAGLDHLGAVVEDSVLVRSLWDRTFRAPAAALTDGPVYTNTAVSDVQGLSPMSSVRVTLTNRADGSVATHRTRLLVAADGARSGVRRMAGIQQSSVVEYGQTALTFTVEVDRPQPHLAGRCYQRFLRSGPLALLPTRSPNHAVVVWSAPPELVERWKGHPDLVPFLNEQLQQGPGALDPLFGGAESALRSLPAPIRHVLYGIDKLLETIPVAASLAALESRPFAAPPHILRVASEQFAFPLVMRHSDRYVLSRLALVGDAAHTVHPFAGQGLNLGLQDASSLAGAIAKAVAAGMDPAAFLGEYGAGRRGQVSAALHGLHATQQLFGMQGGAAKYLKAVGMCALQAAPPLRRAMVEAACFGVPHGPRPRKASVAAPSPA